MENSQAIGIVIPGYGHPQFLTEAIISACEQDYPHPIYVVVVDDGCRYQETGQVVENLMLEFEGHLFYLRQKNTRLPGARNAGVRFLLQLDAGLDCIFFLDADNRLSSFSISQYRMALGDDPKIGWAYPAISFFGLNWAKEDPHILETAPNYSLLKHLASNISEAGSLVRTDVFRAGVFFDESMTFGLEDWDFWLSAIVLGYQGVHATNAGFSYRQRPESMLAESHRSAGEIISGMQRKHKKLYNYHYVSQQVHNEAPSYALILIDQEKVLLTSDIMLDGKVVSLSDFSEMTVKKYHDLKQFFYPENLILIHSEKLEQIRFSCVSIRYLLWKTRGVSAGYSLIIENENIKIKQGNTINKCIGDFYHINAESFFSSLQDTTESFDTFNTLDCRLYGPLYNGPLSANTFVSKTSVKMHLTQLKDAIISSPCPIQHVQCRYAGPDVREIRSKFVKAFCSHEGMEPYPIIIPKGQRRIVVAVKATFLAVQSYCDIIKETLQDLKQANAFVQCILDYHAQDTEKPALPKDWLPYIDDFTPLELLSCRNNFRLYLNRRFEADFFDGGDVDAIVIARGAEAIISFGTTALLEVLGDLKKDGTSGHVVTVGHILPDQQAFEDAKILAYEHSITSVLADSETKYRLSAFGVPPSKIVSHSPSLSILNLLGYDENISVEKTCA